METMIETKFIKTRESHSHSWGALFLSVQDRYAKQNARDSMAHTYACKLTVLQEGPNHPSENQAESRTTKPATFLQAD